MTLIKDINLASPHRAHLDILAELSLDTLIHSQNVHNFDTLHKAWEGLLNTEALNRKFYGELYAWYQWAVAECRFPDDANPVQVIRLITRLLFIWFLKEKGLVPAALFQKEAASAHLKHFSLETSDYYQAILQNLFFATLNTPRDMRAFSPRTFQTHRDASKYRYADLLQNPDAFLAYLQQVPFVNGGLFDCLDTFEGTRAGGTRIDCFTDDAHARQQLYVPAKVFFDADKGLFPLFSHYKFTVEENTPVAQEVALDPELLGKVFENLLGAYTPETQSSARKATGSYYTPREIVDYMVDEALVAVFTQKCTPTDGDAKRWEKRLRYLLDYAQAFDDASEWFDAEETENLVRTIAALTILDPAVGSGAFPMGMLHKLTLVLRRLDADNSRWEALQKERAQQRATAAFDTPDDDTRREELLEIDATFKRYRDSDFGRKLYLIQHCIYGVDIQPVACQIAKLRFFISLAIEQEPDSDAANFGIRPLPNLETRFLAANTLLGLSGEQTFTSARTRELEGEIRRNSERHFHAITRQQKQACQDEDAALREALAAELRDVGMPAEDAEKIASWDRYDTHAVAAWFAPDRMFGIREGFDIVIGNPPYAGGQHLKPTLRKRLKENYGWAGDLYDYFIFAGFGLVSEKGIFSYIANDSYVALSRKQRIRELFLQNQLLHLVKAPGQTFDASIYTAIFVLLKSGGTDSHNYMSGELSFPDFRYRSNGAVAYAAIHEMPDKKFLLSAKNGWVLRLLALDKVGTFCDILNAGITSGNVRHKLFFKENNGRRHRLLQGRQIQRFSIQWDSPKAQYKFCDLDYKPQPIPGISKGGKPSAKNEYWSFSGIDYHHQPERLLMRQTDDDLIVAYHSEAELGRFYTDRTLYTLLPKSENVSLKYLLALFNSRLLNFVYHFVSQEQGKSQAEVKILTVRQLPAVIPSEQEQRRIIALVDEILSAKVSNPNADTIELERRIDQLVYALYELTPAEIAVVEEES